MSMITNNKLSFVCNWSKDRVNSWSGTHFSLFSALSKYFDVEDINIGLLSNSFIDKVLRKLGFTKNDLQLGEIIKKNKSFKADKEQPLIQFNECPYDFNQLQYIYQDLNVGYVVRLLQTMPDIFSISGYQNVDTCKLLKREKYQKNFYLSCYCAGILTMGQWFAKYLKEEYHIPTEKVHHVGGGCNIDVEKIDDSNKEGKRFLFVGRDFKRKNGPLVLDAFKMLHEQFPEYELYIAGPTDLSIAEKGVFCLGNLSYEEEVRYFNLCDVFVMPSLFEAYGLVFPEALTFGLPCIGREAYEMPYFIEEGVTGYLLKKNSVEELSYLMGKAIQDEQLKTNVKAKRGWYLKEYSWDTVASRIVKIIN